MKTKILVCCPNPNDGTSFYRGIGPFTSLAKRDKVELLTADGADWAMLKYCDFVFLQRPGDQSHLDLIDKAKKLGKRVWVDYDDLLTALPDSNPTHAFYSQANVNLGIMECVNEADILTVSTQALADALSPKSIVIPNAWDDDLYPHFAPCSPPTQTKRVLWRGSQTHDEDLLSVLPSLEHLAKAEVDAEWYFLGNPFWLATRTIKKHRSIRIAPWTGIIDYFHTLKDTLPHLMLVPLADSPFNRCKSNIAWMEATWAGAVAIAPNWPEWQRPGVVNYTNDFRDKVKSILHDDEYRARMCTESQRYILETLLLSKINELRLNILK